MIRALNIPKSSRLGTHPQCDQIGQFLNFWATHFMQMLPKILRDVFGLYWNRPFGWKSCVSFWAFFNKNLSFYSNIWSHCGPPSKGSLCTVYSVTTWIYYFYQYLAIYNNGHLPNSIIIGPSSSKILPSTKLTLQNLSKTLNFSPKWQNLAKFGHTDGILASRRHFKSRANHHYSFSHNLIDTSFAIILW